jgi:hypothetical protein
MTEKRKKGIQYRKLLTISIEYLKSKGTIQKQMN